MKKRKRPTNIRKDEKNDNEEITSEDIRTRAIIKHQKLILENRLKKKLIGGNTYENEIKNESEDEEIDKMKNIPKKDYSNLNNNFVQASLKSKEEIIMMKYVEERLKENMNQEVKSQDNRY